MPLPVTSYLASASGRRDEQPNIDLAIRIVKADQKDRVKELAELVVQAKSAVAQDAIKVLYEIGERKAELISPYLQTFIALLDSKHNRLQWGAMSALSAIAASSPEKLGKFIVKIVDAMDKGSVITRDHGVYILASLALVKKHYRDSVDLLFEQIEKAPVNQMPMYAEKTAEVLQPADRQKLVRILEKRKDVLAIPSKAKRIEKLVRSLNT